MRIYRLAAALLALILTLSMTACSSAETAKQSAVGFYLDTVVLLTAYVDDAQVLGKLIALFRQF